MLINIRDSKTATWLWHPLFEFEKLLMSLRSNHLRCLSLAFGSFRKHHHQNVSDQTLIDKYAFLNFSAFHFSTKTDAKFRCRTSHEPNGMQMRLSLIRIRFGSCEVPRLNLASNINNNKNNNNNNFIYIAGKNIQSSIPLYSHQSKTINIII